MAVGLQIEFPPLAEPVLLADMKNYMKVPYPEDDTLISNMIVAARQLVEAFTARAYVTRGYIWTADAFPYFVDSTMSQRAYPPSYYSMPRYATTFWNYSQQISLPISPLVPGSVKILFLGTDEQWHSMLQGQLLWRPQTNYPQGATVDDGNGNMQVAQNAGTSAAQPPNTLAGAVSGAPESPYSWSTLINGTTTESTGLIWKNIGPDPYFSLGPAGLSSNTFLTDYVSEPPRIFPGPAGATWPPVMYVPNAVEIHFQVGYGEGVALATSPVTYAPPTSPSPEGYFERAVTAIMQLVSGWYENRDAISPLTLKEMPQHVKAILWSSRILTMSSQIG